MRRKYSHVCTALFLAALIWTTGGCGGGSSSAPVVYLDGDLHGDLAAQIEKQATVLPFDDKKTDGTVIVSLVEGTELDAATEAGIRAAYDAGQVVAIEHANQSEMRDFLDAIGLEQGYVTPENVTSEDKNLEIFAAVRSGDSVLTYTTHTDHHPVGANEAVDAAADFVDDAGVSSDIDEDTDGGALPDVTADEANTARVATFLKWIATKDMGFSTLGSEGNKAAAKIAASSENEDITKIANAYKVFHDCSEPGHTMHLEYTIYSCHDFDTGDDWYIVTQSGNLNPAKSYQRYLKSHNHEDPDESNYDLINKGDKDYPIKIDDYKYMVVKGYALKYSFLNYIPNAENSSEVILAAENQSPTNVNKNSSKTVGMNWSLGGSLSVNPVGPSGGLTSGLSYSTSRTITASDYSVTNNCCSSYGNDSQWKYNFTRPGQSSHHPDYRGLHDASDASTKNFIPINEWVWRVSRKFREEHMGEKNGQCLFTEFNWARGKTIGAFGNGAWRYNVSKRLDATTKGVTCFSVALPVPPRLATEQYELKFNKSDASSYVNVLSELDWTATVVSADWCSVETSNNKATGRTPYSLLVQVDPNDTGSAREAIIKISDVNGETERTIRVVQSRTN